jgi:MbtH protein
LLTWNPQSMMEKGAMVDDENGEYCVLINGEGQYSLWPAFKEVPAGWTAVGPRGARKECLDYVEANWTDMRPRSLIERQSQRAQSDESSTVH